MKEFIILDDQDVIKGMALIFYLSGLSLILLSWILQCFSHIQSKNQTKLKVIFFKFNSVTS